MASCSSVQEGFENKLKISDDFEGKFSRNSFFIVANDEINASELEMYMVEKIQKKVYPKYTKFFLVSGIHHGMDYSGNVVIGGVDYRLLQGFYGKVFSKLVTLKEQSGNIIWDEMEYRLDLIPLVTNAGELDKSTFQPKYYFLNDLSRRVLKHLAEDLLERTKPYAIIFASCYSFRSEINDILASNGLLASLNMSVDIGNVTSGNVFALDDKQKEIIKMFREPKVDLFCIPIWKNNIKFPFQTMPKNVILYGSSGTGKTLLLAEVLKIKIAHFKMVSRKPIKVLIATYEQMYVKTDQLKQDLKEKYNIQAILEEFEVEPKTIYELSKGNSTIASMRESLHSRLIYHRIQV